MEILARLLECLVQHLLRHYDITDPWTGILQTSSPSCSGVPPRVWFPSPPRSQRTHPPLPRRPRSHHLPRSLQMSPWQLPSPFHTCMASVLFYHHCQRRHVSSTLTFSKFPFSQEVMCLQRARGGAAAIGSCMPSATGNGYFLEHGRVR